MNYHIKPILRQLPLLVILISMIFACCPYGYWADQHGNTYTFLSRPPEVLFGPSIFDKGLVDTSTTTNNCGVWSLAPFEDADPPPAPGNNIAFNAFNLNPNFYDDCCVSYRFEGKSNGSCTNITGVYQNTGGKCFGVGTLDIYVLSLPTYQ